MTAKATHKTPAHSRVGMWIGLAIVAVCVAVVGYIAWNRPATESLAERENRAQVELGRTIYQQTCMDCHGVRLKGKPSWQVESAKQAGIPLNADGITWHLSDRRLFHAIATGIRVKGDEETRIHDKAFAKAQGGNLAEKEIWALIAYFKTTWTARQIESQKETTLREGAAK